MNSPPMSFLSHKRKMGPNQQSITRDMVDGFLKGSAPEKEMMTSFMLSPGCNADLLQNCDLPPPVKLFFGESEVILQKAAMMQQPSPSRKVGEMEDEFAKGFSDDRFSLLRALRLSQTRAREAEKKVVEMSAEKERLSGLLLEESLQLFAHKQWLKLVETEVDYLHSRLALPLLSGKEREQTRPLLAGNERAQKGEKANNSADAGSGWSIALAVCLGVASLGFALGCKYMFWK